MEKKNKKVFVFCIGGTGLRVMKSIIMLLAAGIDSKGFDIIPIIVDPHQDLKEKSDLDILIDNYIKIYNSSVGTGTDDVKNPLNGFFHTTIRRWQSLDSEQNPINDSMADDREFQKYLGISSIDTNDPNNYLIQTLYSHANLTNRLSVGFKGNPNIGTVVLGDMIKGADWFEGFTRHMEQDDRVFIISSIFGGTGASGYPLLEKMIRNYATKPIVKNALIGAITVLPYFALKDPTVTGSDIDSANFLTKTKSALTYYENNVQSDFLYYIGDNGIKEEYENNEKEQNDPAHFIELVAATALFDFLEKKKDNQTQYLSRGIKYNEKILDVISAGDGYKPIVKVIADFKLFHKLVDFIKCESSFPLKITRGLDEQFYKDESFQTLEAFFQHFEKWYKEIANNKRGFAPLSKMENMEAPIKGVYINATQPDYILKMIQAGHADKDGNSSLKLNNLLTYAHQAIDNYTLKILNSIQ